MIAAEQPKIVAEETNYGGEKVVKPVVPIKKKKTVSIKTINNATTWQLETEADVKRYIAELEKKGLTELVAEYQRIYDAKNKE